MLTIKTIIILDIEFVLLFVNRYKNSLKYKQSNKRFEKMEALCCLCLEQEDLTDKERKFVRNVCYCENSYLHRKCLQEWIELSGLKFCRQCHCRYAAKIVPRSMYQYLISCDEEWVRFMQILMRSFNVLQIALVAWYICAYVNLPNLWIPLKFFLRILLDIRICLSIYKIGWFIHDFRKNYDNWKLYCCTVIVDDVNEKPILN